MVQYSWKIYNYTFIAVTQQGSLVLLKWSHNVTPEKKKLRYFNLDITHSPYGFPCYAVQIGDNHQTTCFVEENNQIGTQDGP